VLLNAKTINDVNVVRFTRKTKLTLENAEQVKRELKGFLQSSKFKLIINFKQVTFVDSCGISVLISCLKDAVTHEGWIRLVQVTQPVKTIFQTIKLDKIFSIYDTVAQALEQKPI
jgi:anti-sigma B factor antagonist